MMAQEQAEAGFGKRAKKPNANTRERMSRVALDMRITPIHISAVFLIDDAQQGFVSAPSIRMKGLSTMSIPAIMSFAEIIPTFEFDVC